MTYSSESAGYDARDARAQAKRALSALNASRDAQRIASAELVTAELRVTHALAHFAQVSRVINKRKHHTLTERSDRLSARVPAQSRTTRNVESARTRVDTSHVLYVESRAFNDAEFRAAYDALHLAQHRAECARAKRAGVSRQLDVTVLNDHSACHTSIINALESESHMSR
jgi:hypothetical protein